jgi:outer membrane protein assembly factor BamB
VTYKEILCLLLILFATTFAVAQQPGPTSLPCGQLAALQVNWAQFHFDPCHTGYNPYEKILSLSTVPNLVVDWKYNIPSNLDMYSSPAVVNGIVYVGSVPGVYALDANTGALVWNYSTNCGYSDWSSPAVANGIVYIGCGINNNLSALDAKTGKLLWSVPTDSQVSSSPTVANGMVYFNSGAIFSGGFYVYAVDAKTGALQWKFGTQGTSNFDTPVVADGRVYVGGGYPGEDGLYALDATTGTFIWQFGNGLGCSPAAVTNGAALKRLVYVVCGSSLINTVYALRAATGTVVWQQTLGGGSPWSPAIANGVVYVAPEEDGQLYALDANTGNVLWKAIATSSGSSPVVANGVVYIGSFDYSVYAFNASTGAQLWKYKTGKYVYSTPAVANGKVYIASDDGNVYAFHLPN